MKFKKSKKIKKVNVLFRMNPEVREKLREISKREKIPMLAIIEQLIEKEAEDGKI
ncbi:hypothetical protein LCGC14_2734470 [marine sediment metagenome]|uniref:Ribbon-helix-helix protein CopG domain-containing protein n=1 Tax=marine sediment metagenome TaxID=412755 RepID=A0A0F8Z6C2_9ZZZZ